MSFTRSFSFSSSNPESGKSLKWEKKGNLKIKTSTLFNINWSDPSSWSLLGTNLFAIILAVSQNWNIGEVLWIYWCQNIIIGFFSFLKLLTISNYTTEGISINGKPAKPSRILPIFLAFFFLIHYGIFHMVYASFLTFAGFSLSFSVIALVLILFFLNHLFSFVYNYSKDFSIKQNLSMVMFSPYKRIIPMHLTILLCWAFIGSQLALVFFMTLKTLIDLLTHVSEHSLPNNRAIETEETKTG